MNYPSEILHWLENQEFSAANGRFFPKYNPANGKIFVQVVQGDATDVEKVIDVARKYYIDWSAPRLFIFT